MWIHGFISLPAFLYSSTSQWMTLLSIQLVKRKNLKVFPNDTHKSSFFLLLLISQPSLTALSWASITSHLKYCKGLLAGSFSSSLIFSQLFSTQHLSDNSCSMASHCTKNKIQAVYRDLHRPHRPVLCYFSKKILVHLHHILPQPTMLWPVYPSFSYFIKNIPAFPLQRMFSFPEISSLLHSPGWLLDTFSVISPPHPQILPWMSMLSGIPLSLLLSLILTCFLYGS